MPGTERDGLQSQKPPSQEQRADSLASEADTPLHERRRYATATEQIGCISRSGELSAVLCRRCAPRIERLNFGSAAYARPKPE